jgi:hypothetical protein
MSKKRNEKTDLYAQVNMPPGKEFDFKKELDALLNKAHGSVEEAVEVMTATVKELRRKYADRQPWANAFYMKNAGYLFWLGNCHFPQLRLCRKDCNRLRRTLKQALRQKGETGSELNRYVWVSVDWDLGVLHFSAEDWCMDNEFRLNRRRCRELIAVLAPANLDRLKREYEEGMLDWQAVATP